MYQAADATLIRAASYPRDLTLPAWPDLTADGPEEWMKWLDEAWALPGFASAVAHAAPSLAAQVSRALAGEPMRTRRRRRLVEAAVRYLLRWTSRATPFGRFAGVAPVDLGDHAVVRWGDRHQEVARPDDRVITDCTAVAERDPAALRAVAVVTNALGYARGGVWVLPCARVEDGRVCDVEIALTAPVRTALDAADTAIPFTELTARVAAESAIDRVAAEKLLAALVGAGALLTAIRPPMTVTDPVAHLARHTRPPDPDEGTAIDQRIDCAVTLPPAVLHEAQDAARALVAVAPHLPGWSAYHHAFIERWGPGAAVPLREVLKSLGYPSGYRGAYRRARPVFTARDSRLTALAQEAALDGRTEVDLDDALIASLRGDDERPPIPHTELRFTLAAATPCDLDRGAFTLAVVSGARHAGVAAARFLHLLTPEERQRFRRVYADLPTALPGADTVQVSGPPLDARLATLARTPELLPVLPVGDMHPDPEVTVNDLAVTGDGRRLWLVSSATGRPVEPLLFNSVSLLTAQQPLIRFLTEIWTAWTAPCARFDWGNAHALPFLPRVRRGRSVLSSARWNIPEGALPTRAAAWSEWSDAWQRRRERHRVPREVLIGDDDIRLRLDLEEKAHLAVLRSHLDRHGCAVLTEAPGAAGWIDGRPAELLITLTRSQRHQPPTRQARPVGSAEHRPGASPWLDARLYGHTEQILAALAYGADLPAGWWFLRYPDPEPHLRLRVPLRGAARFAEVARALAGCADRWSGEGLLTDYTLATYRPEARYGTGPTLAAAEEVFAADSRAVLTRLPRDRHASTAAGMIAIAHAFTGNSAEWLVEHVPRRSGPRLTPAQRAETCRPYGDEGLTRALTVYRARAERDGLDTDQLLADLLHLHHARTIGVDTASERHCLRLARAISLTDLAGSVP